MNLDGHGSHVNINFCDSNQILLAIYPPHSTHTLEPLDVALFGPLGKAYSNELNVAHLKGASLMEEHMKKRKGEEKRKAWKQMHEARKRIGLKSTIKRKMNEAALAIPVGSDD